MESTALSTVEHSRLAELESTIARGLQTFVDVGTALLEIRDGRLYRQEYGTFEGYCQDKWGFSRSRAHRLIDAAEVANNLLPIGNIPQNEAQARPLTALPPAEQAAAWQRAVETAPAGKITAAHVRAVVDEMGGGAVREAAQPATYSDGNGTLSIIGDARNMDLSAFPHKYGVIVADPPWPYQQWSERKHGAAAAIYDTLDMPALLDMPVPSLAGPDCALLLWGTWPKLLEALQVMAAWGFEYVTGFPWVKLASENGGPSYGVGFWVRGCSEFVLIGRKGHVSPPRMEGFLGLLSPSLHHSHKPDSVHEIAEALPGPYLELFARRSRKNWTTFGNELEESDVWFGTHL